MDRNELLDEMQERMDRGENAATVLSWLDDIGYSADLGYAPSNEPGYLEASIGAVADSVATFYLSLVRRSIPEYAAVQLTLAFMSNAQAKAVDKE